ncbi:hypothetical protein CJD38_12140 [Stenotrophobium rhamnosiphilum]|uniref:Uncharacterized protein n=1 Tax=Stenotrophobium rhamnosiphilum TaxID=2029166 RepID=A0A2T5MEQ2_9GAMM|nr:hypothetical protein CJD38_12140 [Stenotrophobium rhamnosiphilum]
MRAIIVVALFAVSTTCAAQGPDILAIYDQFVTSRAATAKCVSPPPESLGRFLTNFKMVSGYAAQEVKNRRPKMTVKQVQALMKGRTAAITSSVNSLVAEKGCSNPDIQQLVRRFEVQAQPIPGKR